MYYGSRMSTLSLSTFKYIVFWVAFPISQSVSAQSLNMSVSTTVLNVADTWRLDGTITMPSAQVSEYSSNCTITDLSSSSQICRFDYTACSLPIAAATNSCQCTRKLGDAYSFVVTRPGDLGDSQKSIEASVTTTQLGSSSLRINVTLPLMYQVKLTTSGVKPIPLSRGAVVSYPRGTEMTFCVELPKHSTASVKASLDVGGSGGPCVTFTTPHLDRNIISVKLDFGQYGVDTFSFKLTVTTANEDGTDSGSRSSYDWSHRFVATIFGIFVMKIMS